MSLSPEQLAAYADGELDADAAKEAEAEIASTPRLQAELAAHCTLKAKLAAHFEPITELPVPKRLRRAAMGNREPNNVDLANGGVAQEGRGLPLRWIWGAVGTALAATLALAIFSFGTRSSQSFAEGGLAVALETQLVASQRPNDQVRILLSFRRADGQFCRGFSEPLRAGIACREERGWQLLNVVDGSHRTNQAGEYRPAGSDDVAVLTAIQGMAEGPALDAEEELKAMRQGWHSQKP